MNLKSVTVIIIAIFSVFCARADEVQSSSFGAHFAWGVDAGSSIDISGNDLSSIDISAFFGYKSKVIRALGVGASINSALGNSHALIPVYTLLRTNFSDRPTLCFIETKIGYSFNTLNTPQNQDGIYCSAGLGFNLLCSEKVKSHIILGYSFNGLKEDDSAGYHRFSKNLSAMSIRIGISF